MTWEYFFSILTFWTSMHLPNFITLSNLPSNLFPHSFLSFPQSSSLFVSMIYWYIFLYICSYACYIISIFMFVNTEIKKNCIGNWIFFLVFIFFFLFLKKNLKISLVYLNIYWNDKKERKDYLMCCVKTVIHMYFHEFQLKMKYV